MPVEVGRGGNEEVNVVARRVGLKRRDDGYKTQCKFVETQITELRSLFAAKSAHNLADPQASPFVSHLNFRSSIPGIPK